MSCLLFHICGHFRVSMICPLRTKSFWNVGQAINGNQPKWKQRCSYSPIYYSHTFKRSPSYSLANFLLCLSSLRCSVPFDDNKFPKNVRQRKKNLLCLGKWGNHQIVNVIATSTVRSQRSMYSVPDTAAYLRRHLKELMKYPRFQWQMRQVKPNGRRFLLRFYA